MTGDISRQLSLETCIQQLPECVGRTLGGPVTSSEIRLSRNDHSIDITLTVSCAKSSDTARTTEASPQPSPSKPPSPSQSSLDSNQSTSELSLHIFDGTRGPTINFELLASLLRSQGVNVGSSADAQSPQPLGRLLLMIHKEAWLTS